MIVCGVCWFPSVGGVDICIGVWCYREYIDTLFSSGRWSNPRYRYIDNRPGAVVGVGTLVSIVICVEKVLEFYTVVRYKLK